MPYKGIGDCLRTMAAEKRILSLFRGNTNVVVRYFPTQALHFAFKDCFKRAVAVPESASRYKKLLSNIAVGSAASTNHIEE